MTSPEQPPRDGPTRQPMRSKSAGLLKRPLTLTNNLDYQTADSEHVPERTRLSDEKNNIPDDLPKAMVMSLSQGSTVKSMDFHPVQQFWLLVGTNTGEIMVWELVSRERVAHKSFRVWNLEALSLALQTSLASDYTASINRVIWSPDGTLFGVAYSKHIVHICSYLGDNLRNHLQIEAHDGSVNDLAFSYPKKHLCIVTCGEDRLIKVWDTVNGLKQYTFEGHEAPIYSVCPHYTTHDKKNVKSILSNATDGKMKAWLYAGPRVDLDLPGHSSMTMSLSADGTRLFSCGTNKEGESYLVELNVSEGEVIRTYNGLGKRATGIVQFDTMTNRFLAAGDEFMIKFWDMDNVNMLTTIDADGGLPASPRIRFNKEGTLLAVSTNENGIKILANQDGLRQLKAMQDFQKEKKKAMENCRLDVSRVGSGSHVKNGDNQSRVWKLTEITEPSQCRSLRLWDNLTAMRVSRLIYTNSGLAILALDANAVHKLWNWPRHAKATSSVTPQLMQPLSGIQMINDIGDTNPEDAVPCFALSKNGYHVMSASGGKISKFNMKSFRKNTLPLPPAATFLAFHPQDNTILAIGMEDSSIQIYNVGDILIYNEFKTKLRGHQKRITGLAFSNALNVLVSSGADSQLCVWSTDVWDKHTSKFTQKKHTSKYLQIPSGRAAAPLAETCVQFHQDQRHLLAVHETHIAIYEAPKLDLLKQWVPREASWRITHATYSCDSQSIFVSLEDGSVGVLTASTLGLRCRINPTSYLPAIPNMQVYPLVIAAHPSEPNQFALGLSNGEVHVIEPLESEGKWGTSTPIENGAGRPSTSGVASSDQPQR